MSQEKESAARQQLPYKAEYCKTSRAKCKKCSEPMESGSLKLASSVKSRFHDGYDYSYHHIDCFFRIKRPTSVAEIGHFETLKYEDQKMLEEAIETKGQSVLSSTKNPKDSKDSKNGDSSRKKKKHDAPSDDLLNYDDFLMDYAKSNRSQCLKCGDKIEKGLPRIAKYDYNSETSFKGGPIPRWYHTGCFAKSLEQVEFYGDISKVSGFKDLDKADKEELKRTVKFIKPGEASAAGDVKKVKKEAKVDSDEEKILRKQSDRFFRLRELINSMKRKDIEAMLEHMKQKHDFKNSATLVDMATDVLLFGPLAKCPECKQTGHILLRTSRYICTSKTPEGSSCTFESSDPPRGVPDVPSNIEETYEFFDSFKFKPRKRIFPSNLIKAVEEKEAENKSTVMTDGPLEGLTIGVTSWQAIQTDRTKVQKKITMLGGKLTTALHKSLFVILTSEDELNKDTPKIEVAKALEIPFTSEKFLFTIESKSDVVKEATKCLINKWDGDLRERFDRLREAGINASPIKSEDA